MTRCALWLPQIGSDVFPDPPIYANPSYIDALMAAGMYGVLEDPLLFLRTSNTVLLPGTSVYLGTPQEYAVYLLTVGGNSYFESRDLTLIQVSLAIEKSVSPDTLVAWLQKHLVRESELSAEQLGL